MKSNFVSALFVAVTLLSNSAMAAENSKTAPASSKSASSAATAKPTGTVGNAGAALAPAGAANSPFSPENCPVVGNKTSKIYHMKGGASYEKMLKSKPASADNRECFKTEDDAKKAGFRKSKS